MMTADQVEGFLALGAAVLATAIVLYGLINAWDKAHHPKSADKLVLPKDHPHPGDPIGGRTANALEEMLRELVHQEVALVLRGRSSKTFDGTPDAHLAMELIARGWVAYKPSQDLKKS